MLEKGYNVTISNDVVVYAPSGLPENIKDYISECFEKMAENEIIVKELKNNGLNAVYLKGDELLKN